MPAFRFGGRVVAGFAATKGGCSYFSFSGRTLETMAAKLRRYQRTRSSLQFDSANGLPAPLVRKIMHRGPYSGIPEAHAALHVWCAANGRRIGGYSLEIYSDPSNDPSRTVTTIQYLLR